MEADRHAHLQEAACARVLIYVDNQIAGWGALHSPVLDVDSAS